MNHSFIGKQICISGIVQGVGFRPFLFNLAKKNQITGWVRNSSSGVEIIANGNELNITIFIEAIKNQPPPLARIDSVTIVEIAPDGFEDFSILESDTQDKGFMPISPDVSICEDCKNELFDRHNRRFRYPFINCTNCGPRLTIIKDIPYDRPYTTMAEFRICPECRAEYDNPLDRRFHAQPIACHTCGPHIWFEDSNNSVITGEAGLQKTREWIAAGKIIAVKGLGGFHLVCNGLDQAAVASLRERKNRTDKPFAVMAFDLNTAEKYARFSQSEKELLSSRENPIVIGLRTHEKSLVDSIAPYSNTLGIMLPYTPLHYLLLEPVTSFPDVLVMTSGNLSDEPIAYTNGCAKRDLGSLADGFLFNNRAIETRVDDSVVVGVNQSPYFFRRSRGYAPNPLQMPRSLPEVLAVGAELKNTFCLTKDRYAFISHHIGDLQNEETLMAFEEGIPHFEKLFKISPTALACDMHPDYLSTQYATQRMRRESLPLFTVQHHHAHLAACLADNQWETDEPVIGVIFDGTGYGTDGKIWGGEIFYGNYRQVQRVFHLSNFPLPGGDTATRHPKRIGAAYLWQTGLEWDKRIPAISALNPQEFTLLFTQLENQVNCAQTSSMGRLFDAVASLTGLRQQITYEAQAAIELENSINHNIKDAYQFDVLTTEIDPTPVIKSIIEDVFNHRPIPEISAKFHNAIRRMVVEVCSRMRNLNGCRHVVLSGGVMQNRYLIENFIRDLNTAGFTPLWHKNVPANDGGVSLGQAMIACHQIK